MKALSFLGLFATVGIFGLTWCLGYQGCYNWECNCAHHIELKDYYILASLIFSMFFLTYCVIFLFKINELTQIQQEEKSDRLLDSNLIETNYTVYQLGSVRLLTKVGFLMSIGLFAFAFISNNFSCIPELSCNEVCSGSFSYDQEIYTLGYGGTGIYFFMLTLTGLLKSYPSKY